MINIDWEKLRSVHSRLIESGELEDNTDITFIILTKQGNAKKSIIKFKDFMNFFWSLSENEGLSVLTLVAQDRAGRILYRYKQKNVANEEIPDGGNTNVIQYWNAFSNDEKETYLKLLLSQIQGYQ